MEFALVVVRAFGPHEPGDTIDQEDAVRAALAGEHAGHVVRVACHADAETKTSATMTRED